MNNIYTVPQQHRHLFTKIVGFESLNLHSQKGRDCVEAIDSASRYCRDELFGGSDHDIEMAWMRTSDECASIIRSAS